VGLGVGTVGGGCVPPGFSGLGGGGVGTGGSVVPPGLSGSGGGGVGAGVGVAVGSGVAVGGGVGVAVGSGVGVGRGVGVAVGSGVGVGVSGSGVGVGGSGVGVGGSGVGVGGSGVGVGGSGVGAGPNTIVESLQQPARPANPVTFPSPGYRVVTDSVVLESTIQKTPPMPGVQPGLHPTTWVPGCVSKVTVSGSSPSEVTLIVQVSDSPGVEA
jgi:hypothetical protein